MADSFASLLQALSQTGCQCHAIRLTALGITSLRALSDRASEAALQGVDAEDIAKVLTAARLTSPRAVAEPGRADLPVRRRYTSASFDAALSAARPENRKRSLNDWMPTCWPARHGLRHGSASVRRGTSSPGPSLSTPSRTFVRPSVDTPRSKGTSRPPSSIKKRSS